MKRKSFGIRMAALAGLCLLVAQGASSAAAPIGLTTPVQATKNDLNPGRLYSPPAFAVDPDNNMRVLAAVADHRSRRCHILRSTDGGQTWNMLEASPALASYPFCSHGQGGVIQAPIAFGRNGTVYTKWWQASGPPGWRNWFSLGAPSPGVGSSGVAAVGRLGRSDRLTPPPAPSQVSPPWNWTNSSRPLFLPVAACASASCVGLGAAYHDRQHHILARIKIGQQMVKLIDKTEGLAAQLGPRVVGHGGSSRRGVPARGRAPPLITSLQLRARPP